jgi:hypothetical protein
MTEEKKYLKNKKIKNMKTILIAVTMGLFAFAAKDKLTGRWESKPSIKGNTTGIVFKPNNSFEGYINKKPFVTGNYTLEDSLFSFVDNGCDGKKGVYKIIFFSNEDSIRFEVITDSCTERRNGMSRTILGRVKK